MRTFCKRRNCKRLPERGGEVAGTLGEMTRKRAYLLQGAASSPGCLAFGRGCPLARSWGSSREEIAVTSCDSGVSPGPSETGLQGPLTNQPVAAGPQPRMPGLQLLTPPHLRGKRCCVCVCVCVCVCESTNCQLQAEPLCSAYSKCSCREEAPLPGPHPPLPA